MLVLLPPSQTKRSGGDSAPAPLALPALDPLRARVREALVALSADEVLARRRLGLGERQLGEIAVNAALAEDPPLLPAIERYTGVLFDALDIDTLDDDARAWLGSHAMIHSAAWGLVGALDPLPAYRMDSGTSVPGIGSTKRFWNAAITAALEESAPDFVLDLRSESYAALGPVPASVPSRYVRVVTEGDDGTMRALNHFNKRGKGELLRALASSGATVGSAEELCAWAETRGIRLSEHDGELVYVTDDVPIAVKRAAARGA